MQQVAALFVETGGVYFNVPDVDPWDEARDARLYSGPDPVVAHPPCHLWGNLAFVNYKRYGGDHNRPGNDGGCFERALRAVRTYGGVLEHPAFTNAWACFGLKRPPKAGWSTPACLPGEPPSSPRSEWTCEVWQSAYGHKARKRTWLFYVGTRPPFALNWSRRPGTHQCGWFDRNKPTLGKAEASATPPDFRDKLLRLARWSKLK